MASLTSITSAAPAPAPIPPMQAGPALAAPAPIDPIDAFIAKGYSKYTKGLQNSEDEILTRATTVSSSRNREFIGGVLKKYLTGPNLSVFEVGTGTATQPEYYCTLLQNVTWQTSDLPEYHDVIKRTVAQARNPRLLAPLKFDIDTDEIPGGRKYNAVYASNVVHCIPWETTQKLFKKASDAMMENAYFILYGSYNEADAKYDTAGNQRFDAKLKKQDPSIGLKDLEKIKELAKQNGLTFVANEFHQASNNCTLIFQKVLPKALPAS